MPTLDLQQNNRCPLIMGIVNVTPDSFSDGGRFLGSDAGIAHGLRLLSEGADILDIGGESTRPPGIDYGEGFQRVDANEERNRVLPVIRGILAERSDAVISIDTVKPDVAEAALEAGAAIVNDVSGGQYDERIWNVAARVGAPYILMHGHNPHEIMPRDTAGYADVVVDVIRFLRERIERAGEAGVQEIIADPGIGFAKGAEDSLRLLRELKAFRSLGVPLLVGASRKSCIGRALPPDSPGRTSPEERLFGTLGAHAAAFLNGADILRVHDVRPAVEFFSIFSKLNSD